MAWNFTCWYTLITSELIWFWSTCVDFPHFGIILTLWNRPNLQLRNVFWGTQGRNGLNFGMLMYPDHLQNLLNIGNGLLIFLVVASLSDPSLWWLYVFSSFTPRPPPPSPPRLPPQQLLPLTSKPFELNLRYLAQRINGFREMYWMTFPWPSPKVMAVASISKNLLVCAIKWEPFIGSLQNAAS